MKSGTHFCLVAFFSLVRNTLQHFVTSLMTTFSVCDHFGVDDAPTQYVMRTFFFRSSLSHARQRAHTDSINFQFAECIFFLVFVVVVAVFVCDACIAFTQMSSVNGE